MLNRLFLIIVRVSLFSIMSLSCFANKTILAFGDSLTSAYGIEPSKGWVALLNNTLEEAKSPFKVINSGIAGNTSAQGLARLPKALEKHEPKIVILALGANDGLQGLSLIALKENLSRMINLCQKVGAKVLLFAVELPPNYGPKYVVKFEKLYQKLAKEHAIPLVYFSQEEILSKPEWMLEDKIHPNAHAQPYIHNKVLKNLQAVELL